MQQIIPAIALEIIVLVLGVVMLLAEAFAGRADRSNLARYAIAVLAIVLGFSFFPTAMPEVIEKGSYWNFYSIDATAMFFKRIALNFLRHGSLAWNPDEGPVYGLTSQSFAMIAVPITALASDYSMIATRLFLVLCLIAAHALLLRITARADRGACATYAFCSPVITFAALSGMETAFALLLLAAFLWAVYAAADSLHWTVAPLLVLLVYVTRPDAALLAAPVLLVERTRRNGRVPVRDLLLLGAGMVTLLSAFRLAYGTALPLPFYAKSAAFSPYDAHFREISAHAGAIRAGLFAAIALPLVGLGSLDFCCARRLGSRVAGARAGRTRGARPARIHRAEPERGSAAPGHGLPRQNAGRAGSSGTTVPSIR